MLAFLDASEVEGLLRAVAPACKEPEEWAPHLSKAMHRFGIMNDLSFVAAFIAQLMVESSRLNRVAENLSYTADRLLVVWPSRFPSIAVAQRYAHNERDLANYVYGGRMGNAGADDGWMFRGRGPLQVTGRANYLRLQNILGIPLIAHPELLEQKAPGAMAAAWFWWDHRLSFLAADLPDDDGRADFVTLTRRVNGGVHGLAQRQAYWRTAREYLELKEIA